MSAGRGRILALLRQATMGESESAGQSDGQSSDNRAPRVSDSGIRTSEATPPPPETQGRGRGRILETISMQSGSKVFPNNIYYVA